MNSRSYQEWLHKPAEIARRCIDHLNSLPADKQLAEWKRFGSIADVIFSPVTTPAPSPDRTEANK